MIDIEKIKKNLESALHEIEHTFNVEEGELLHDQIKVTLETLDNISNKDVFSLEEVNCLMNCSRSVGECHDVSSWDEERQTLINDFYKNRKVSK